MAVDMKLVRKGRGEPRAALAEQARVLAGLAKQHVTELDRAGWKPAKQAALDAGISAIESTAAAKADAAEGARGSTGAEHEAIAAAKRYIRRLRNAVPSALADAPVADVTVKSFNAGGRLGRVTKDISGYLGNVRPFVVKLDAALKPYFEDKTASAELDQVKGALDAADTKQEVDLANLPEATLQVYEAKGRVLRLIEELNRLAKNALDGQAELVGKFNKDILLRGRGPAKPKVPNPPG